MSRIPDRGPRNDSAINKSPVIVDSGRMPFDLQLQNRLKLDCVKLRTTLDWIPSNRMSKCAVGEERSELSPKNKYYSIKGTRNKQHNGE